ncbi:MAG: hypothetical protein ABEJ02_01620 [Candidatus Paceibacteria bacterium]
MGNWINSLTKLKDYYSKNGKRLPVDLSSEELSDKIDSAVEHILPEQELGPKITFIQEKIKLNFITPL